MHPKVFISFKLLPVVIHVKKVYKLREKFVNLINDLISTGSFKLFKYRERVYIEY